MKFCIQQIAIHPRNPEAAMELLAAMGADEWFADIVVARGQVNEDSATRGMDGIHRTIHDAAVSLRRANCEDDRGDESTNVAALNFNYQLDPRGAQEFEVLSYEAGRNWMDKDFRVSHLGMHCTEAQLDQWKEFFANRHIGIAQEVNTVSHTNPVIAGKRKYHYCIFNTYPILGVDIKFIVRKDVTQECAQ